MTSDAAMETELSSVLTDPTFVRSPVLARLLTFLVRATESGEGRSLKSFSVAVDGLGRSPELDPQVDTYARVQVARLRKALDGFYNAAGAKRGQRLTIDSGSYEVKLVPHAPPTAPEQPTPPPRRIRPIPALVALAALLVLSIWAIAVWRAESRASLDRWGTGNFPSVTVSVEDQTKGSSASDVAELVRFELMMRIGRYQGIRIQYDSAANATYAVNLKLRRSGGDLLADTFVVHRPTGRLVWSAASTVEIDPTDVSLRRNAYISRTAFLIAHGTGVINASERRRNLKPDTPYGCWLRFTMLMRNNHLVNDPALAECAADWHAAIPDHPTASSLYAWTLLDQSIMAISAEHRRELIDKAVVTLERARALSPTSGFLPAVAVRAYALADEDIAMRASADQTLEVNPGNLEIQGLVGTMLTMRNDPRGLAILDDAIAQHPNPPPWYFIAKFVSAMMREDTVGAGRALGQLRRINHSLPVLHVLAAAYEARTGQLPRARASWERAKRMQPTLRIDPDIFLTRLPLALPVTERLKLWLKPVIDS